MSPRDGEAFFNSAITATPDCGASLQILAKAARDMAFSLALKGANVGHTPRLGNFAAGSSDNLVEAGRHGGPKIIRDRLCLSCLQVLSADGQSSDPFPGRREHRIK